MVTRVSFVSASAAVGGSERSLGRLARDLAGRGLDVDVTFLEPGPAAGWLGDVPVQVVPAGRGREVHRAAVTTARLVAHLRRRRTDVVVSNMVKSHAYAGVAARLARIPAVLWQHTLPGTDRVTRAARLVGADLVVCVGTAAAEQQRAAWPGAAVEVVHPGIDLVALRAARGSGVDVRAEIGCGDAPLVGMVARIHPGKGHELFLDAARLLARRRTDVRFAVVGGSTDRGGLIAARLTSVAEEDDLAGRVFLAGHRDDAEAWLDAMDVLVHPSGSESFGMVVAEAMAIGTPAVVLPGDGPQEVVADGLAGVVVEAAAPGPIADAVGALLDDPAERAALVAAAGERVEAFDHVVAAARFTGLLDRVAAQRRTDS